MTMLEKILHNPYQYSATILAKGAVNIANICWCVVVLLKEDALSPFSSYRPMLALFPEDVWAWGLLVLSSIMLYRLVRCMQPRKLGFLAYMLVVGFWSNIWWGIVIQPGPFWPAAFASVTVVVLLALFAFISNPKRGA